MTVGVCNGSLNDVTEVDVTGIPVVAPFSGFYTFPTMVVLKQATCRWSHPQS